MQRCTIWKKNSNNLTEAEEIKKRWQEYTEDLYKKVLMTWLTTMVVILECEVKWALGSTTRHKASGGDAIPAELFQILIGESVKVLHSVCQKIWKTQQWSGKDQFSLQCQRLAMPKNAQSESESHSVVSNSL